MDERQLLAICETCHGKKGWYRSYSPGVLWDWCEDCDGTGFKCGAVGHV